MRMPAMSPTMTEGGIAGWKKNEGESFAAGDVLLEIVRGVVLRYQVFASRFRLKAIKTQSVVDLYHRQTGPEFS